MQPTRPLFHRGRVLVIDAKAEHCHTTILDRMTRSWADDACLARLSGVSWIYWLRSDGATEHWRSHAVCMSNTVSYGFGPTATSRVRGAISPARSSASRIADSATESGASPSRAKPNSLATRASAA